MLYFPIVEGNYPDWLPWVGGNRFQFFRPVFNIADTSIFIGVVLILLFQKRYLNYKKKEDGQINEAATTAPHSPVSEADEGTTDGNASDYTHGHTDNGVEKVTSLPDTDGSTPDTPTKKDDE